MIWVAVAGGWALAILVGWALARAAAGRQHAERGTQIADRRTPRLNSVRGLEPERWKPAADVVRGYGSLLLKRLAVQSCRVSGADQVAILIVDGESLVPVAVHGADEELLGARFPAALEPFADLRRSGRALLAPAWRHAALGAILPTATMTAVAPVIAAGEVRGFLLAASSGTRRALVPGDVRIVTQLAELAALAIDDAAAHRELDATIAGGAAALAGALDKHLLVPGEARADVAPIARAVGRRLGLDSAALIELDLAARLHEVGRLVTTPPAAPRRLEGAAAVGAHAPAGAGMLANVPGLQAVSIVVGHIGECWDGRGRPDALAGDRIPLASRILAAAAAFERASSLGDRGAPLGAHGALRFVEGLAGRQFDPVVVEALGEALKFPGSPREADGGQTGPVAGWAERDAEPVLVQAV